MMADCFWCLKREVGSSRYSQKHRKADFRISKCAIFSVMGKPYAIMYVLILHFNAFFVTTIFALQNAKP